MASNWIVTKDLFLSQDEVATLYGHLKDARDLALLRRSFYVHIRDYYIFRVLLETGVRVFELTALNCGDLHNGALIIERGKGNKKRHILLAKETQKTILEYLKVKAKTLGEPTGDEDYLFLSERKKPYSTRGIRKRVKLWFSKCGFKKNLSVHSCRHSYISHMLAKNVDLLTVRDNAGHSSLAVTSIYSHAIKDNLGDLELYSSDFSRKQNF